MSGDARQVSQVPMCLPFDLPPPEDDGFVDRARDWLSVTVPPPPPVPQRHRGMVSDSAQAPVASGLDGGA